MQISLKFREKRLLESYESDSSSLSKEDLYRVSNIYHSKAKRLLESGIQTAWDEEDHARKEINLILNSYTLLWKSARAAHLAGRGDIACEYCLNASWLAESAANLLISYSRRFARSDAAKYDHSRLTVSVLGDAASLARTGGDEKAYSRLIGRREIVSKSQYVASIESAIHHLDSPIDPKRLEDLNQSLRVAIRDLSSALAR